MRTKFFVLVAALFVALPMAMSGQKLAKKLKNAKGIQITYQQSYKGKVSDNLSQMTIVGNAMSYSALPGKEVVEESDIFKPISLATYLDYDKMMNYRVATLPSGKKVSTADAFVIGDKLTPMDGEVTILGLKCKHLRTINNSNTYDIWYTTDLPGYRGTPNTLGICDGLVLRFVRNGDGIVEATNIEPLKTVQNVIPEDRGNVMDYYDFRYATNHANVVDVRVFDQDRVCFNNAKLGDDLKEGIVYPAAGGSIILKKVKLPKSSRDYTIYLTTTQYSDGDAYDRTGSVFVIPMDKQQSFIDMLRDLNSVPAKTIGGDSYPGLISTDGYNVPLELQRFFTGFGVRQFNYNKVSGQEWVDSVTYKTDVTSLARNLEGEVWVGAYIGNWDAKGHKLSVKLSYHPSGNQRQYRTMPLFNTVNYMEQAGQKYPTFMLDDKLTSTFTLTEDVEHAHLYYITTGHGGWGGGDEFNQKINTISIDGDRVASFIPWREDCATYRNNNPCSGDASNGETSSDYSRSNWCPGTVTNPEYIYLGNLKAGTHTITVEIPQGAPEGGSNSYWCISGTLLY